MSQVTDRRWLTLLAGSLAALVVSPGAAAAKSHVSCDARSGSTMAEDAQARLFTLHKKGYACARPYGVPTQLRGGEFLTSAGDYRLAGPFVGWKHTNAHGSVHITVTVRNVKTTQQRDQAFESAEPYDSARIDDYVLNSRGAVAWIQTYNDIPHGKSYAAVCESTPVAAPPTNGDSTQCDGSGHHTETLARGIPSEFSSLALSTSGRTAYWMDHGTPRAAGIP